MDEGAPRGSMRSKLIKMRRGDLEFSVGDGGDFSWQELRLLEPQAPLPEDVLRAILSVKRELGGKVEKCKQKRRPL